MLKRYTIILILMSSVIWGQYSGGTGRGDVGVLISEGPLPVELVSFSANVIDGNVLLTWNTATEVDNYGFEVQKSVVKDEWQNLGFVIGAGNSNSPKNYEFTDRNVSGFAVKYRLKQIDNSGKIEYSTVIEVNLKGNEKYELAQNFPNPFNPSTNIMFNLKQQSMVKLSVFNILGETVALLVNEVKDPGAYSVKFDASNLNTGVYFYQLETEDFNQVNKMMFVK